MSADLDLDDVAASHPKALAQLAELRAQLDAALQVVIDLDGEVRLPEIEEARALRRDAERWRFVKTSTGGMKPYGQSTASMLIDFVFGRRVRNHHSTGWVKDLDAAIDAAMKESK